ncbi:MAG: DUF3048 domain-containing protein [Candidatus Saccharibacteria bacterium]|nr:DUF3048 domain-containing protein [Candidatus Saccharibacteria bacterium]
MNEKAQTTDETANDEHRDIHSNGGKLWVVFLVFGLLTFGGGVGLIIWTLLQPPAEVAKFDFPKIPSKTEDTNIIYSDLTGEALAEASLKNAPTYCIQTPNGTDGARPQAGLNTAGVIFEAIAESGITRFAAIYQNPSSAVIGPIRSLRLYYLQWDTPFNCTIVHAGGADDALAAVRAGGYRDLTENYTYMYRGTYGGRLWNNLFTTASLLKQFGADRGYDSSEVTGFSHMTPEASKKARIDSLVGSKLVITAPAAGNTSELIPKVSEIGLNFGGWANFNVRYKYDVGTNKYLRSYESGAAHEVYSCPNEDLGEKNPEDVCELVQMAPSAVVAMVVSEQRAWDGYHEDITTLGSGDVYIFQNGGVTQGTWHKDDVGSQIRFQDEQGNEIKLTPGQTIVSAIPTYGSIDF